MNKTSLLFLTLSVCALHGSDNSEENIALTKPRQRSLQLTEGFKDRVTSFKNNLKNKTSKSISYIKNSVSELSSNFREEIKEKEEKIKMINAIMAFSVQFGLEFWNIGHDMEIHNNPLFPTVLGATALLTPHVANIYLWYKRIYKKEETKSKNFKKLMSLNGIAAASDTVVMTGLTILHDLLVHNNKALAPNIFVGTLLNIPAVLNCFFIEKSLSKNPLDSNV